MPYRLTFHERTDFEIYSQLVAEYSSRQLSFEADVYNAFRGALSALLKGELFLQSFKGNIPSLLLDSRCFGGRLGPFEDGAETLGLLCRLGTGQAGLAELSIMSPSILLNEP